MTNTFLVSGMTCDSCATSVTKAIKAIEPHANVSVNVDKGHVTVYGADEQQVFQAVISAGFKYEGTVSAS